MKNYGFQSGSIASILHIGKHTYNICFFINESFVKDKVLYPSHAYMHTVYGETKKPNKK